MNDFIFEKNIFMEGFVNRFKSLLISKNKQFSEVEILPFSHELLNLSPKIPDNANVIFFGSIGGAKVAKEHGWKVYDYNFGVLEYKKLGDAFLNYDAVISKFSEVDLDSLPDLFFLRPESGNKEFTGTLIEKDKFVEWRDNLVKIGYLDNEDFLVSVSSPKNLNREVRCIVKNGHLISCSQYRTKYSRTYKNMDGTDEAWFLALCIPIFNMQYRPDDIYCIDFGELDDHSWKVIEYNCFNSAGLYDCDELKVYNMFYED